MLLSIHPLKSSSIQPLFHPLVHSLYAPLLVILVHSLDALDHLLLVLSYASPLFRVSRASRACTGAGGRVGEQGVQSRGVDASSEWSEYLLYSCERVCVRTYACVCGGG
jgi:hypothetical protein